MRLWLAAAGLLAGSCATLEAKPSYLTGAWGGEHVGIVFEGALANIEYDCASGTIDTIVLPATDGRFVARGKHRPGQDGPIRVGQVFRSLSATYAGQVRKDVMTLTATLEDGTSLGPFTLTRGATPQIMRCL